MAYTRLALISAGALLLAAANPVATAIASPSLATTLSVEQLGPKFLLSSQSAHTWVIASATIPIPIDAKTLEVEELGPKYLLGS